MPFFEILHVNEIKTEPEEETIEIIEVSSDDEAEA